MSWRDEARKKKFQENKSWSEIANELRGYFPDLNLNQIREKIRTYLRNQPEYKTVNAQKEETDYSANVKQEYNGKTGETTFEGIVKLMEGELITPESIMQAHNLNSTVWDVVTYKTNFWQTQAKGGKKLLLYQSKITVRPRSKNEITLEDIDRYFENKDYSKDKLPVECLNYDENGEILIVKICDLHIGMLSWRDETGEDYDLKIAKKRYFSCINDIVTRCEGKKLAKIVFVTLGDVVHCDNDKQETTNGTFQQIDGRLAKITECVEDMLIDTITMLGKIAPVEYIYTAGNHDRLIGYMLARSVSNVFRRDSNVSCDILPNPIKKRLYGCYLELYHHGDAPKKNIAELPMKHAREEVGKSKFVTVSLGHYHDEETKSINGARVRYFPTICGSSYWEYQQCYGSSLRAVVCDVVNEKTGLRDTWYTAV